MWWSEFETKLTNAFAMIDKESGRQVYSNSAKLRLLNKKVKADFLEQSKAVIELELSRVPMTMTYNLALATYRNAVNRKFPPETTATNNRRTRRIQETGTDMSNRNQRNRHNNNNGNGGRGNSRGGGRNQNNGGRGRGRGRGGRGGRGYNGNQVTVSDSGRTDAWFVQCTDGTRLEVHPQYRFTREDWNKIPNHVRDDLAARRRNFRNSRSLSQASSYGSYAPLPPQVYQAPQHPPHGPPPQFIGQASVQTIDRRNMPPPPPAANGGHHREQDNRTMISEITTHNHDDRSSYAGTIMGGRNEQAVMRNRQNRRWIGKIRTSTRNVASATSKVLEPEPNTEAMNEADTNADTCCLGTNFIPISFTNRTADVYPYNSDYEPALNIPIVSGAMAYDHEDGNTYILVFHESLYYGQKLGHSLINPNQVRHGGIDFWDNPYDKDRELCIEASDGTTIPLRYNGTKLIFSTRVPTNQELAECTHIDMTDKKPWEPSTVRLGEANSGDRNQSRYIFSVKTGTAPFSHHPFCHATTPEVRYTDPTSDEAILHSIEPSLVDFNAWMISKVDARPMSSELDNMPEYIPARRTFTDRQRHRKLNAQSLAELWNIGIRKAKDTINATTQHMVRSAILPIARRYRADRMYNIKRLQGKFATDTFYSPIKSVRGNTCAQIYSNKCGFSVCYPMSNANRESVGSTLSDFIHDYGAPSHLTFDGAQVQVGRKTKFQQVLRQHNIDHHVSALRRPNENPGESAIRLVKLRMYRYAHRRQEPRRYWDFLLIWICETGNLTVSNSKYAKGRTALEIITGITPDISEYVDFGFYDWVTYRTNAGLGPLSLGRWLGVSHKVGQLMSYWVLTKSGKIISCVTVQRAMQSELDTDEYKKLTQEFTEAIDRINDAIAIDLADRIQHIPEWNRLSIDENDPDFVAEFQRVDIMTEVSMLSAYQASPRQGHLEQVYHIFAYLKHKPKLTLYFDPRLPSIDPSWARGDGAEIFKETYRDAKEEMPPKHLLPQPRGRCITMTAFVDASHAANKVTRRSHTGFIIFINRAPIIFYSKRQNTVESSAFSSEFIAMKTCVEHITALRFKLRMFGVPVNDSAKVLCDNESVVKNSSKLDSVLNKKHCSLAYHATGWAVAASIISIGWIPSGMNLADAMTKRLTANKRESLFGSWTY